jgi:3-oxoacyl-[acyl-carrier-protein] synthase-1
MNISILSHSVVSPLGIGSEENFMAIQKGNTGIELIDDKNLSSTPFYAAQLSDLRTGDRLTRFEHAAYISVMDTLNKNSYPIDVKRTAFVLATTKGNIELIAKSKFSSDLQLGPSASRIAGMIGVDKSFVVSNACTSGVMAVILAKQLLQTKAFDHVIVNGTDVLSQFIVSGFQSLHALSDSPCKPFDETRNGLNLGEASATMIVTSAHKTEYCISGSAATNDSNHISGPSRTGEELSIAIKNALRNSGMNGGDLDFISAHGTATLFNDEMEAKAFSAAGVSNIPVNSLKGYFGHTLGAAGLVEIIMSVQSLKHNELTPTKGFGKSGVSQPLNVIQRVEKKPLGSFLKTASGFGGCNAAIIIKKNT